METIVVVILASIAIYIHLKTAKNFRLSEAYKLGGNCTKEFKEVSVKYLLKGLTGLMINIIILITIISMS